MCEHAFNKKFHVNLTSLPKGNTFERLFNFENTFIGEGLFKLHNMNSTFIFFLGGGGHLHKLLGK